MLRCLIMMCLIGILATACQQAPQHATAGAPAPGDAEELQNAAAAGDADAQYELAFLYMSGRGVERNTHQALRWYRAAAAQGHAGAQKAIDRLEDEDFVEARAEAQQRETRIRGLQRRLRRLGYDTGDDDGLIGPSTLAAIDAFGASVGLRFDPDAPGELTAHLDRAIAARAKTENLASVDEDLEAPKISIPAEIRAVDSRINFSGQVEDASLIAEVRVNGRPIPIEYDGTFRVRRFVSRRLDQVVVTAVDEWGNDAQTTAAVVHRLALVNETRDVEFGRYHALVIGNNEYEHLPNLKTAVVDARAVAETLREDYGFDVSLLLNTTRAEIKRELARYRSELDAWDNLLIYYAGHGWDDIEAGEGYWLPADARADDPSNWLANHSLTTTLRAVKAKHVLIVADSCFSGTLTRGAFVRRRDRDAFQRAVESRGRSALTSGGIEPVVDGGGGEHSVFAVHLLRALRENEGVLDAGSLFGDVRESVIRAAEQTPQYGDISRAGHEGGEFFFVRADHEGGPVNSRRRPR